MSLPWNICVVSWMIDTPELLSELSNALLYGTEVIWVPARLPVTVSMVHEPEPGIHKMLERMNPDPGYTQLRLAEERCLKGHQLLMEDISNAGLPITVPQNLKPEFLFSRLRQEPIRAVFQLTLESQGGWYSDVITHMKNARACIIDRESPYILQTPAHWDTDRATQHLMQALSSVLLPDIATLPLLEVMQLREDVKDEIEPMRAALLRLTEDLRKMVENRCSEEEVAREAVNLIKTRVEPFVREVDQHVRDQANKKWNKFFQGALKAIFFAGAGYLKPDLFKDSLKEAVNVVASTVSEKDQNKLPGAAQFVLEVRRSYQEKYRY